MLCVDGSPPPRHVEKSSWWRNKKSSSNFYQDVNFTLEDKKTLILMQPRQKQSGGSLIIVVIAFFGPIDPIHFSCNISKYLIPRSWLDGRLDWLSLREKLSSRISTCRSQKIQSNYTDSLIFVFFARAHVRPHKTESPSGIRKKSKKGPSKTELYPNGSHVWSTFWISLKR